VGWRDLHNTLEKLLGAEKRPHNLIRAILDSPYIDYLNNEYPNARERCEDLDQLASFAERYQELVEFLTEVALNDALYQTTSRKQKGQTEKRKIILSTIHQAKGLDWDTVFVIHMTNSGFPNQRAFMEPGGLEEERRLFYVAVTRAKHRLFLCYPRRAGFDEITIEYPSMFITETDPSCLDLPDEEILNGEKNCFGSDYLYADADYEDETVNVDDGYKMFEVKKRVRDWKKKNFLREIK
jgi:DNA helicase-2/ATP-dependent DNA helicase PcrA